jgi:putative ABC transport system permease protein
MPPPRASRARLLLEALRQAAASARSHPLRSGLGALAVAASVATVAVVGAALDGVQRFARESTARSFGADTFLIAKIASPGSLSRRELADKQARNRPLRRAEARFLERYAEGRVVYAPSAQRVADATAGSRKYEGAAVTGTTASLADVRDVALEAGRFLDAADEVRAAQVAVIGAELAETLFPGLDPLGRRVRIAGRGFTVVGVQAAQGVTAGTNLDRYVYVPLTAFERAFGASDGLVVYGHPRGATSEPAAEGHARVTLRARRQLAPGVPDDFDLLSPEAARGFVFRLTERVGAAAVPLGAMALLAAVIVVTNTTLVSVSERTREIGVRRALGATRGQLLVETLAESALVALVGGLLGLAGVALALDALSRALPVALALAPQTALVGLAAATATGLLAGLYPARQATRVDIVSALRAD